VHPGDIALGPAPSCRIDGAGGGAATPKVEGDAERVLGHHAVMTGKQTDVELIAAREDMFVTSPPEKVVTIHDAGSTKRAS
jgi:hypothetical protein